MNGAESLVRTLKAAGIEVCFTNPGTSEMHFVAALDRLNLLRCILALQENVATGAADGYARMTGKPAATLLHLGPGFANGLANVHNAKKARVPMVNIVGDHAIYHVKYDAPLTADIEGIAGPVSDWVRTTKSADDVGADAAEAVAAANGWPGRIATLMLPADAAWTETGNVGVPIEAEAPQPVSDAAVAEAVRVLSSSKKTALFVSGASLVEPGLTKLGKIAAKARCDLICQASNRRVDRGAGRVAVKRLPYPIDLALQMLAPYEALVLIGAPEPVGFFAYPGKPSRLAAEGAEIVSLATPLQDTEDALDRLIAALGAGDAEPALRAAAPPPDPKSITGDVGPETISRALSAVFPENAVIVDESITTGRMFYPDTEGAPKHTWLQITGGAIGDGLPMAVGAAIACPDRKVIALQSDGSAMYTNQALWTMARERLDVAVLLFSNRAYRILEGEMIGVGVDKQGAVADALFGLNDPEIDWCRMAESMGVAALRVERAEDLAPAFADAIAHPGPKLVEIVF